MLTQLPKNLQEEIIFLLRTDKFFAAKQVHDEWLAQHASNDNNKDVNCRDTMSV